MKRESLFSYVQEKYAVEPDYPWDEDTAAVLRHPQSLKWFALIMEVKPEVLCLKQCEERNIYEENKILNVMNVKLDPLLIQDLLHEEGFVPAYHMNKKYWISILLDYVSDETVKSMIENSWNLVKPRVRAKRTQQ